MTTTNLSPHSYPDLAINLPIELPLKGSILWLCDDSFLRFNGDLFTICAPLYDFGNSLFWGLVMGFETGD
ncbi:2178_t:CDS:2 [Dentiscutata erythropus]|uniref:2178_t:CDS:1 n=1 Tax=Dentiscutata erythropus TaxID=1348616 RepID=A0A9N8VNZ8_9GLOM|nr:2178_t:CDS:2 [Dentiscutata erythropus]